MFERETATQVACVTIPYLEQTRYALPFKAGFYIKDFFRTARVMHPLFAPLGAIHSSLGALVPYTVQETQDTYKRLPAVALCIATGIAEVYATDYLEKNNYSKLSSIIKLVAEPVYSIQLAKFFGCFAASSTTNKCECFKNARAITNIAKLSAQTYNFFKKN